VSGRTVCLTGNFHGRAEARTRLVPPMQATIRLAWTMMFHPQLEG
jgi:hypothetical protein